MAAESSEEKSADARQKTLARELEWIRMSPRARQAKSKARIRAYEQMSQQAFEERPDEFEVQIPPGKRLGDMVIEAQGVTKAYGENVLMEKMDFRLVEDVVKVFVLADGLAKLFDLSLAIDGFARDHVKTPGGVLF